MKAIPVNLISLRHGTPLHMCLIENIDIQVLEELIAAGANVNTPNRESQTPLHLAMKCDHRYAHFLLRNGALDTINARDRLGRTPLHHAVTERHFDTVSLLLYYNADANIEDSQGLTPFMLTNFHPANSCSIQDTLLEYENAMLSEKGDYDLDIFTESRLHKILSLCIRHKNLRMFKSVWSRISPEVVELIPDLSPDVIIYAPLDFIDFLLRNYHIDLAKILNLCPTIEDLWRPYICDDNLIGMLVNIVYLFLSYGGIFSVGDIQFLQRFQEYEAAKELIRVFLFMDIDKSFQRVLRNFSDIPYIIPYITCNINEKFEDIIDDYCQQFFTSFCRVSFMFGEVEKNMQQFLRFCACDKFLKLYKQYITSLLECILETPELIVPSLEELSRNRAKDRICEKYKIKNACQFYTTLESLPMIPRIVKDIIAFRAPVYGRAGCKIIQVSPK